MYSIKGVAVDTGMLLFPLDAVTAEWASLITSDTALATRVTALTGPVINHAHRSQSWAQRLRRSSRINLLIIEARELGSVRLKTCFAIRDTGSVCKV